MARSSLGFSSEGLERPLESRALGPNMGWSSEKTWHGWIFLEACSHIHNLECNMTHHLAVNQIPVVSVMVAIFGQR